jgi:hypothetical protein
MEKISFKMAFLIVLFVVTCESLSNNPISYFFIFFLFIVLYEFLSLLTIVFFVGGGVGGLYDHIQ